MAKRYHHSKHGHHLSHKEAEHMEHEKEMKHRGHHSGGMKMHSPHEAHAEGYGEMKRQERMFGSMIAEDHGAIANLPQMVMMKPYARPQTYLPEDIDDSIRGIDMQLEDDNAHKPGRFNPKKY